MAYYIEINSDGTPKTGSIVLTSKEGHPNPLIDITDPVSKLYFGSGKEQFTPRYFIEIDNNGVPLSNTVTITKPESGRWVDITESYLVQSMIDPYLLDENTLYALVIVGNSNSTGMSGQSAPVGYVNESINNNKKVQWNSDNSAMEVVDNITYTTENNKDRLPQHIFQPGFYGYYNPAVLMANEMSRLIKERTGKTIQFISVSGATNGAMIDNGADTLPELSNNSTHFQYLQQGIQTAKTYATSIGKAFKVPFVVMIEGEVESIRFNVIPETEYRYRSTLNVYRRNLQTMVHAITGDDYNFPVIRHQLHAQQTTDDINMTMKQIVLNSHFNDMPVIFPTYHLSILSNFDHWDTIAIFKMYGFFTYSIFKYHYQKNKVLFKPKKITVSGNTITIQVSVPVSPMRIDTSRGVETNHGFTLKNGSNVEIEINSVTIVGNSIVLEAVSNPIGGTLYYKLKRPYAPDLNRFGSYIVDSDYISSYGYTLWNYLLSFKQVLT